MFEWREYGGQRTVSAFQLGTEIVLTHVIDPTLHVSYLFVAIGILRNSTEIFFMSTLIVCNE